MSGQPQARQRLHSKLIMVRQLPPSRRKWRVFNGRTGRTFVITAPFSRRPGQILAGSRLDQPASPDLGKEEFGRGRKEIDRVDPRICTDNPVADLNSGTE